MKIETKYAVNDMIWFYFNGKVIEAPIYKVDIEVYENLTTIRYMINVGTSGAIKFEMVKEEFAFETKQELIKSL
jgi:H2-forming N5,N10-methylenetetrahydromethanopterin dehydrogenase-like enzyme